VYIEPVDEKRKILYNALFSRRWLEIRMNFEVAGRKGNLDVAYAPSDYFDAFFVIRKKG
jgi:hypothetical protein